MQSRVFRALNLVLLWAVVKLAAIYTFVVGPNEYSDTYYYFLQCEKAVAQGTGLAGLAPEYPTPAAALLYLPWVLGMQDYESYRFGFLVLITAFDLAFVLLLIGRASAVAVLAWILLETLSGRLALLRFDLIPAVLAAAAILLVLRRRQPAAAAVLAGGTSAKVWPIVLVPLLLGDRRNRGKTLVAFVASGVVAVAIAVALGGWQRLFTPLTFQSERGLQIEAVAATVPMVLRLDDPAYSTYYSQFNAFEVAGPVVPAMLTVASVASVAAVLVFAWLLYRWFRAGAPAASVGSLALFEVAAFMVTSRVLSPQYFLWLAALIVVLLGLAWRDPQRLEPGRALIAFVWISVLLVLTWFIYPVHYDAIWQGNEPGPVSLLAVRNLLLVAGLVWIGVTAARHNPADDARERRP